MTYLGSEPLRKYYHASKCSCATLLCLFLWIFTIIVPFFLGISTYNFWPEQFEYAEQPTIKYRDEAIILTVDSTATNPITNGYSTVSELNDRFINKVQGPSVSASSIDSNNDGKPESIQFTISFSSTATMSQIYLFFDVSFRDKVSLQMQDFLVFTVGSGAAIAGATIEGDIKFNQANPIQSSTVPRSVYNTSVFQEPVQNLDPISLLERKMRRNETISCQYNTIIKTGGATGAMTEIIINLDIPLKQTLWYIPTLFQNLKFAWIQFIYLFIPIYWITQWVMRFAYRNKIFPVSITSDINLNKLE